METKHVTEEQKSFLSDLEPIKPKLLFLYRVRVPEGETWLLYRDGLLVQKRSAGPYSWSSLFFHKWEYQIINSRIELLPIKVHGRVRGPGGLQDISGGASSVVGAPSVELACEVDAQLQLSIKITNIENFIQYRHPITVFESSVSNMVVELIGQLPYDQYGQWATQLRDAIQDRLQGRSQGGRDDSERRLGILVDEVFVTGIQPNSVKDRNTLQMYQLVEKARRELVEVQAQAQRDKIQATSFAEQGQIINLVPSILALRDNPIGRVLIEQDAQLRGLVNYTGGDSLLASGGQPTPYLNPPASPQINRNAEQVSGYLLPVGNQGPNTGSFGVGTPYGQRPPAMDNQGPNTGNFGFGTPYNQSSPSMGNQGPNTGNFGFETPYGQGPFGDNDDPPVDPVRQQNEIMALEQAGFKVAGRGKVSPRYNEQGELVPGSKEWNLQVLYQRTDGYLTIIFYCPSGYPAQAPRVQVKPPTGGFTWITPNTTHAWNPSRKLLEIAQEVVQSFPLA